MLGAPVRSDLIEFRSNECDERWQLDRGRRPNDVRIDSPVLVNHKIAHARHCLPRSAGESYSSRWSDPLRRLTDDCEVEHHCTQDRVVVPEDFVRHAFDSVLDPSASVCDVPQSRAVATRHSELPQVQHRAHPPSDRAASQHQQDNRTLLQAIV